MNSIFDKNDFLKILQRVETIQRDSIRQWGTMNVAQMMAHVTSGIEMALGKITIQDRSNFITRWIIKPIALSSIPIKRNIKSSQPNVEISLETFDSEKMRLLNVLQEMKARGSIGKWYPHPAFGSLTGEEWGRLIFKHLDHHFRQFSN